MFGKRPWWGIWTITKNSFCATRCGDGDITDEQLVSSDEYAITEFLVYVFYFLFCYFNIILAIICPLFYSQLLDFQKTWTFDI